MTTTPKIALAKVNNRECYVTPLGSGFQATGGTWYDAHEVEIIEWLAVIRPSDTKMLVTILLQDDAKDLTDALREIADPIPPLPEEPPIRSFLKDRYDNEWAVRTDGKMIALSDTGDGYGLSWRTWCEQFGPGEVLS